ncbi:SLC5A6 [Acanthosepion pharaonis]|uniref:SLC5A6 n=1 Tax=Acanthosepion pharaonis TaxID=158019 RepID=A0A812DCA5_ACAPH|nr:SLC5A6 [Sepia pharaonis]
MYTAIGGFRAVIWTDVFQMIVILSSLIVMNIIGVQKGDRWPYFLFDPDPRILYSVWSTILGSTFTGIASFSFNQMIIQRFVSLPKKKHAIASIYAALPVALLMTTLLTITGLVIYANYANCAPDGDYSKLLLKFVIETLGVFQGMTGVFVSCIFCGALSANFYYLPSTANNIYSNLQSIYLSHFDHIYLSISVY